MCKALNYTYWPWTSKGGQQANEQSQQARGKGVTMAFYGTIQTKFQVRMLVLQVVHLEQPSWNSPGESLARVWGQEHRLDGRVSLKPHLGNSLC